MTASERKRGREDIDDDDYHQDVPNPLKYRKLNTENKEDTSNNDTPNDIIKNNKLPINTKINGSKLLNVLLDGMIYIIDSTQCGIYDRITFKSQLIKNLDEEYWSNILCVINMNNGLYAINRNSKLLDITFELQLELIDNDDSMLKLSQFTTNPFKCAILMDNDNKNIICAVSNHTVSASLFLYKDTKNKMHQFGNIGIYNKMILMELNINEHNDDCSYTANHHNLSTSFDCISLTHGDQIKNLRRNGKLMIIYGIMEQLRHSWKI